MKTFKKLPAQRLAERIVPCAMGVVLLFGAYSERGTLLSLFLGLFGAVCIIVGLSVKSPTNIIVNSAALTLRYSRGKDLSIPYAQLKPNISLPRFRMTYQPPGQRRRIVDLGSYWTENGARVTDQAVCAEIEKASGTSIQY